MIILQDNKEKNPWDFTFFGFQQEVTNIKTGDYTIKGLEHVVVIERKASTGEIATNFGAKWKRFENELKRMDNVIHKYIVCEFPITNINIFPANSGIPPKSLHKIRMNSGYLFKQIEYVKNTYNIEFIFANNHNEANIKVKELFQWIYQSYQKMIN